MESNRRQINPSDKRVRILAASRKLFAADGFAATTVPAIVRTAGVAQGTFYRYFQSKNDIIQALTVELQEDLDAALLPVLEQAAESDAPFTTIVKPMIRAALRVAGNYHDVFRFLNTEALMFGKSEEARSQRSPYVRVVTRMLRRDQRQGSISSDLNPAIAASLVAAVLDHVAREVLLTKPGAAVNHASTGRLIAQADLFLRRALSAD